MLEIARPLPGTGGVTAPRRLWSRPRGPTALGAVLPAGGRGRRGAAPGQAVPGRPAHARPPIGGERGRGERQLVLFPPNRPRVPAGAPQCRAVPLHSCPGKASCQRREEDLTVLRRTRGRRFDKAPNSQRAPPRAKRGRWRGVFPPVQPGRAV